MTTNPKPGLSDERLDAYALEILRDILDGQMNYPEVINDREKISMALKAVRDECQKEVDKEVQEDTQEYLDRWYKMKLERDAALKECQNLSLPGEQELQQMLKKLKGIPELKGYHEGKLLWPPGSPATRISEWEWDVNDVIGLLESLLRSNTKPAEKATPHEEDISHREYPAPSENIPDQGQSVCKHNNPRPMECKLCRGIKGDGS